MPFGSMRRWPVDERELKSELSRRGFSWQEQEVRLAERMARISAPGGDVGPARPKYLARIRDFALGE